MNVLHVIILSRTFLLLSKHIGVIILLLCHKLERPADDLKNNGNFSVKSSGKLPACNNM